MEFDTNILLNNISYILEKNSLKIGEFERECGVSVGYLARLNSKERKSNPGIDFIKNAADILNISIDTLVNIDISLLSPTDEYLIKFIEKLISDTDNNKLLWKSKDAYTLNNLQADWNGLTGSDLVIPHDEFSYDENGQINRTKRIYFDSNSYGPNTKINGNCYKLEMKEYVTLYLMPVTSSDTTNDLINNSSVIELWMSSLEDGSQYVTDTKYNTYISKLLHILYNSIHENLSHPQIAKSYQSAIDSYLNDDESNVVPKND